MRLIDADEILKALQYNTKTVIGEIKDVNGLVAVDMKTLMNFIEKMPTAYDVEAVVAKLEASAEGAKDSKDLGKWSAYQKAISIVRGKE